MLSKSSTMNLKIFNTLTREIEEFSPQKPDKVRIYVCGPTVYDDPHIGHARTYGFFDLLRRFLEYLGYVVDLVVNITDIDDKVISRARAEGRSWQDISQRYARRFFESMKTLNIKEATSYPQASAHIAEIIELIESLMKKGYAYKSGEDVYFSVNKVESYGKLSRQKIEDLIPGARVEPGDKKLNPLDFALWKGSKPGEPYWHSPWGPGRPGWHIECSAMAIKYLGQPDIHGGGSDLIFPHHENEIVQSEAYLGSTFAKYWVHVALLTVGSEKMSKSIGNIITIDEFIKKFSPETLRLYLLSSHYRKPLEFSWEGVRHAENVLERMRRIYNELLPYATEFFEEKDDEVERYWRGFLVSLCNDMNTPEAMVFLHKLIDHAYKSIDKREEKSLPSIFKKLSTASEIFGIKLVKEVTKTKLIDELINLLIEVRSKLRERKDYALSDEIRERLRALGVQIFDGPKHTMWSWKS